MSVVEQCPAAGMGARPPTGVGGVPVLVLEGQVHPSAVMALHRRIAAALDAADTGRFVVDLGAVTSVGTQTLSLFCGALRRLSHRGATLTIVGADAAISRMLEVYEIDRVVLQPSGQANRSGQAPSSGRMS